MLDTLPSEIIEQILGHLPTAASIVNLACANRKLHATVSVDNYGVFRNFVQRAFPSIRTPPMWRDMACQLTSRSRAWDRRAFIARECQPPKDAANGPNWLDLSTKFGYVPVIDSYEEFPTASLASRKEVLAFGAAGRLRLRTTIRGKTEWSSLRSDDDHLPQFDIVDVKLLRPHQHQHQDGEVLILRRANGEIVKVKSNSKADDFACTTKYTTESSHIDCIDISDDADPLLAVCNTRSLKLFSVNSSKEVTQSEETVPLAQHFNNKHRMRCVKFLAHDTIATTLQFVEGRERAPIQIYNIGSSSLTQSAELEPSHTLCSAESASLLGRHAANTIVRLDNPTSMVSSSGQVFLSGWTDGYVRLHDLRTPQQPVMEYIDPVDDGQILSLVTFGHEKFLAGSHQNACLKIFDLRMGATRYSYLDALPASSKLSPLHSPPDQPALSLKSLSLSSSTAASTTQPITTPSTKTRRDINIFLALTVNRGGHLWQPLPRRNVNNTNTNNNNNNNTHARLPRYRGSIYSLSSPSASSPTVYAGIENHVLQLDFVSTDDLRVRDDNYNKTFWDDDAASENTIQQVPRKLNHEYYSSLGLATSVDPADVLNLSCYERPRDGYVATDAVLLRKQVDWAGVVDVAGGAGGGQDRRRARAEPGWDERWSMANSWKRWGDQDHWRRGQAQT